MSTPGLVDPARTLFRKTRRQLLGWLFTHTDESFYVRELVRVSGAAVGSVSRELEELAAGGIVRRSVRGNQVFYQADASCPIFAELKSISLKTAGLADQLREALVGLAKRIDAAVIFGSGARGSLRAQSDVDLLIVGSISFGEVVSTLASAQKRIGREINPSVYSREEFRSRLRSRSHFLSQLVKSPLQYVIGAPGDLERLGEERMDSAEPDHAGGNRRPAGARRPGSLRQRGGRHKP